MSVLVVGLSHRTAPVALLERVSVSGDSLVKLLQDVQRDVHVTEAMVVSTCNRVEVYVEVDRFHAAVTSISWLLSTHSGVPMDELAAHLYVHYEDRAIEHLFSVGSGLDSMVLGEGQILGQVRSALRLAQEEGTLGPTLNELVQQSLRVGKRSHTETGIDRAGASLVGVGLTLAERVLGPLAEKRALVVGAGSMSALSAATLQRAGLTDIVVVNRTHDRAVRLAQTVGGRAAEFGDLEREMAGVDLVISCTGAADVVITADMVTPHQMFILDLALPHDVDLAVRRLPGVTLVDLESMQESGADAGTDDGGRAEAVTAVRDIVAEEVAAYLSAERAARVTPTVVALRSKAAQVVETELERFAARVPELDGRIRAEVTQTLRRVVDKLLHEPTVRVKQLAESPAGDHYAEALRELFNLDPKVPEAVRRIETIDVEPGKNTEPSKKEAGL
ncbi:glutamyl-tRNA reductase [Streptosporangium sp. NBC_01755]|uniref:glutamyl-tRNA reductase n=1 Tax=unclassified Streptosporangium TaxID=2632669 RepID=UPI002DD87367|nr:MULTISPECIES: glutamyl-tRNA reductase [unclassified Streptosporangium]WSA24853.1 glutamyl-tRNA reductase [Streptosporangium sp. NBC_01810]WSD03964.1 glutamyl-tRNA reductase [Streptosporangium sp. NBC_01755]